MKFSKTSSGFTHLFLVLIVAAFVVSGGFFLFTLDRSQLSQRGGDPVPVKGVSTHQVLAPTGQIAFIPKAECTAFVALTGDDSNSGATEALAKRTIQKAVDTATAGSVVCIKGGEYRQLVEITNKMGTANSPIKVGGYSGGGLPILTGGILPNDHYKLPNPQCTTELDKCNQRGEAGECLDRHPCMHAPLLAVMESDYIQVIGIDTRGSSGVGTTVAGSNHILVRGIRAYHNWGIGFKVRDLGGTRYGGIDNRIEKIAVYDNLRAYAEKRFIGGSGFVAVGVSDGYIKDSLVFENFGEGLDVGRGATDFTIENNILWENFHASLYINAAKNVSVNRNFVFCTGNRVKWLDDNNAPTGNDGFGTAITVRNEVGGSLKHGVGGGTVVANNTTVGCTKGIVVGTQKNSPLIGARILNNSIISARNSLGKSGAGLILRLGDNSYFENVVVANNIVTVNLDNPQIAVLMGNALSHSGVRYTNNYTNKNPQGVNTGFTVGDPKVSGSLGLTQMLNPASAYPYNYVITQGSPAVDTASAIAEGRNLDKTDMFGNQRNGSVFDAGSYELGQPKNWPDLYATVLMGNGSSDDEDDDDEPTPVCGNGIQEQGESCDLGSANGVCPSTCNTSCSVNTCDGDDDDDDDDDDSVVGANVLRNSGFAQTATSANEFAKYWSFTKGKLGSATVTLVNASASSLGRGKMTKISVSKNPLRGYPSISQKNVDLDPSKTYEISFVAKSSSNARVFVAFRDMGYIESLLAPTTRFDVGTSWATYKVNVSTNAFNPNKAAHVYVGYDAPDGSNLLIDTVMVKELQ
ncbi:right-handed parallel beta-helix repeat-containing protein [Patescibacteria group bacterium]|nr:right-handed parallel beta-helix repeat-containing protein [Patescibacteria group bacterium]